MAIRLLHLADVHLGAHGSWLGKRAEARRADFTAAFDRAVEFALEPENAIDGVLISGDLFDSHRPSADLVATVRTGVGLLQDVGKPVLILPGLHDGLAYPDSVYYTESFPGAHVLLNRDPVVLTLQETACHFYGFPIREGSESGELARRSDTTGIHVGLLHASLAGSPDFDRYSAKAVVTREELAATRMDYFALGHFHNHQVEVEDGVTCAYAGSLVATSFNDLAPRVLLVVELAPGAPAHLHTTPFEVGRRLAEQRIDVGACRSQDEVAALLAQQADDKLLVRFVLSGALDFVLDAHSLQHALQDAFFWVEIEDATTLSGSGRLRVIASEPTVRGRFAAALRVEMEEPSADHATLEVALKAGLRRFLEEELL